MYYKASLLTDNSIHFEELSDEEALPFCESVYSFVLDAYTSGMYAVRPTKEEAVQALLDLFQEHIKQHQCTIKELQESVTALKVYAHVPRCWECKHWGSVSVWTGEYVEGLHHTCVSATGYQTAPCPFHRIKSGKRPRCIPRYSKVCEHFEEYKKSAE